MNILTKSTLEMVLEKAGSANLTALAKVAEKNLSRDLDRASTDLDNALSAMEKAEADRVDAELRISVLGKNLSKVQRVLGK